MGFGGFHTQLQKRNDLLSSPKSTALRESQMPGNNRKMDEAQANLTERELEKLFTPVDSGKLPVDRKKRPLRYHGNKPRQPARTTWYQAINPTEDLESEFLRRIS